MNRPQKKHIPSTLSFPADETPAQSHLPDSSVSAQDVLIEEILRLACDTSILNGKELKEKILLLLDLKIKNEMMIGQLLNAGVVHDKINVQEAAQINNRSKDSVADLYKLVEKLPGSQSDMNVNVKVESEEINEAIRRARRQMAQGFPASYGSAQ